MAVKIKLLMSIIIPIISVGCNNLKFQLKSKFNVNHTSTVYLLKNGDLRDSLVVSNYYGKDSIISLDNDTWIYTYVDRCGTGCSLGKQIVFSVKKNKLNKDLQIESYYQEGILGDETFEKSFKRKTDIIKINDSKSINLLRRCFKNDVEFSSKTEKLQYDEEKQIYYNEKITFNDNVYNGIKIDSSEYIFYKNDWFEFDSREGKILE